MSPQQQQQHFFQQQQQQLEQMQQQMTLQQQQQFLMNANAMSNMGAANNFDMMSPQQQVQQQQLQQMRLIQMRQQLMNNQIQQQQQNQPQQMHMNQLRQQQQNKQHEPQQQQQFQQNIQTQSASEMQMLQSKLAQIYSAEAFDPRPIADQTLSTKTFNTNNTMNNINNNNNNNNNLGKNVTKQNSEVGGMDSTHHADNRGRGGNSSRVEIPPGNNPRRMPPPSLLKRDDSLKMDKIFEPNSPGEGDTKKKYGDTHGSSAHLSAMSLSMGDLNDDGNLSQVFDSSLKISGGNSQKSNGSSIKIKVGGAPTTSNNSTAKLQQNFKASSTGLWGESKTGDPTVNNHSWENANFDMSVATLGASEIAASEVGNLSYATFNMPDHDGQMSFSRVFEEAEKWSEKSRSIKLICQTDLRFLTWDSIIKSDFQDQRCPILQMIFCLFLCQDL